MAYRKLNCYEPKTKFGKLILANFYRYCMSAMLMNFSTYYMNILIPLVSSDMDASSLAIGLLQSVQNIIYAIVSLVVGSWLAERVYPGFLIRGAAVSFIICAVIAILAKTVGILYISMIFLGICGGTYWTCVIDAFGREAGDKRSQRSAIFSVCHATGKSLGFMLAGVLKGLLGITWTFGVLLILLSLQLIVVPIGTLPEKKETKNKAEVQVVNNPTQPSHIPDLDGESPVHTPVPQRSDSVELHVVEPSSSHSPSPSSSHSPSPSSSISVSPSPAFSASPAFSVSPSPSASPNPEGGHKMHHHLLNHHRIPRRSRSTIPPAQLKLLEGNHKLFRFLGWLSNFSGYSVCVTICNQYVTLAEMDNIHFPGVGKKPTETFLGIFCGIIYLSQMFTSLTCSFWKGWMYNRFFLYLTELLGMIACVIGAEVENCWALLFAAVLLGIMVGTSNLSSMTYSIEGKGKSVGIHEFLLTVGGIILPPSVGALVTATHEPRTVFWVCGGLIGLVAVAQEILAEAFVWHFALQNNKQASAVLSITNDSTTLRKDISILYPTTPAPSTTPTAPSVTPSPRASFDESTTQGSSHGEIPLVSEGKDVSGESKKKPEDEHHHHHHHHHNQHHHNHHHHDHDGDKTPKEESGSSTPQAVVTDV